MQLTILRCSNAFRGNAPFPYCRSDRNGRRKGAKSPNIKSRLVGAGNAIGVVNSGGLERGFVCKIAAESYAREHCAIERQLTGCAKGSAIRSSRHPAGTAEARSRKRGGDLKTKSPQKSRRSRA